MYSYDITLYKWRDIRTKLKHNKKINNYNYEINVTTLCTTTIMKFDVYNCPNTDPLEVVENDQIKTKRVNWSVKTFPEEIYTVDRKGLFIQRVCVPFDIFWKMENWKCGKETTTKAHFLIVTLISHEMGQSFHVSLMHRDKCIEKCLGNVANHIGTWISSLLHPQD